MQHYSTYEPSTYVELERLAGISDREQFWRQFRSEAAARAEIHAMYDLLRARGDITLPHASLWTDIRIKRKIPMQDWIREAILEKLGREAPRPGPLEGLSEVDHARMRRLSDFLRTAPDRLKKASDLSLEILDEILAVARGDK